MKMGKTGIIMAGFLAFTLCFSVPVWAGDTADEPQEDSGSISLLGDDGLISRLFGEGGALSDIVPDTIDPGQVMQSVGDMLEDPDSMLNQTIDGVKEMVTGEDGSIDWTKLQEKAGDLIEFFSGGGGTEGSGKPSDQKVEELLRQFDNMDAAMKEYVFTYNSDLLESGDVQIFTKKTAYTDELDLDKIRVLAEFSQDNYKIEDDQLKYLCGNAKPMLLTLVKEADGSYSVTDGAFTEDGEGFDASLQALCDQVGISIDEYYAFMVFDAYNNADAVAEYLEAHPEISAAEYMGEMKTAEELRAMANAYIDSFFEGTEEEVSEA